ncbi:uncharacterized protein LOC130693030 [Daphnia carinata]|uniref:uncharacterized protein LOC130693030 n=1 Tax=Daphnia carinata TaxID=120202 RepID=UPI00257F3802|nr:uncharacterized protein LOC130693030 [Daphnia carinata]
MACQCFICGFQLQLGISSHLGPYLFRIPSSVRPCLLFVCSIHFGSECLKLRNNVWYLRKNSIPTQYLGPYFHFKKVEVGIFLGNKLENSKSKIKDKMENNGKKENITSTCSSSCTSLSMFDVDPDMPKLFLDHGECGSPQNLTSRRRKLKLNASTQIWSYECVSFSEDESDDSSPPPLLRFHEEDKEAFASYLSKQNYLVPKDLSLSAPEITGPKENEGWEEQTSVHSVCSMDLSHNSRCSTGIKTKLRKLPWRKARALRYCTLVSDTPFLSRRRTRKTKSKISLSCSEKYRNDILNTECKTRRQVDEIDGFTISSFFTIEDLDDFCAQQFQMNGNMKITSKLSVEGTETEIHTPSFFPTTPVLQHAVKTPVSGIIPAKKCATFAELLPFASEREIAGPFLSCNSMVVSKKSEIRSSARAKIHSRKSSLRNPGHYRHCTPASNFLCIGVAPIIKTIPMRSLLSERIIGDFSTIKCETLRQIDEIDGVTISSFFTSEDLEKFCTQQCQIRTDEKVTPNCPIEYTEAEKQDCSSVLDSSVWPDTAEIIDCDICSTERYPAICESLQFAAPNERR